MLSLITRIIFGEFGYGRNFRTDSCLNIFAIREEEKKHVNLTKNARYPTDEFVIFRIKYVSPRIERINESTRPGILKIKKRAYFTEWSNFFNNRNCLAGVLIKLWKSVVSPRRIGKHARGSFFYLYFYVGREHAGYLF